MTQSPFVLRLADSTDYPADRLTSLDTRPSTGPTLFKDHLDMIAMILGDKIPQGSLFAYLFRRFGFPNKGSDPDKELVSYLLNTSHPGMLLSITPYAGGDTNISFRCMVAHEVEEKGRAWMWRSRDAHEATLLTWIETEHGVPDWVEGTIKEMRDSGMHLGSAEPALRQVVPALGWIGFNAKRAGAADPRVEWLKTMRSEFAQISPQPGADYRSPDWRAWEEADPLKPYAAALDETLKELLRPVWVRDVPIDPWGRVDEGEAFDTDCYLGEQGDDAEYHAPAAGYPSGDLANYNPELFSNIHNAIVKLGQGNPVVGMRKAETLLLNEIAATTASD